MKVMIAMLARKYVVELENPDADPAQLVLGRDGDGVPVRMRRLDECADT